MSDNKASYRFYVLVSLMMVEYVDKITVALLKRGYTVGPLSADEQIFNTLDTRVSTTLLLDLRRSLSAKEASDLNKAREFVFSEVITIITETNSLCFFAMIGDPTSGYNWNHGNIRRDVASKPRPAKKPKPAHLHLIESGPFKKDDNISEEDNTKQ